MASTALVTQRYDVEALRQTQFPVTRDTIYLNCAAISPLPQRTFDAMRTSEEYMLLNPLDAFEAYVMPKWAAFNEAIKSLLNAKEVEEVVGVFSTSLGINLLAQALTWHAGDNIILCDGEFPTNVYAWMQLQEQYGVELRIIPPQDGGLTLDAVKAAADEKTRLVAASHVQFFSGHRTDLAAIGGFCRANNILFSVDAIQSAGHIAIDVQAMNIDMLVAGGHKSLMGPSGQGIMYVRRDVAESMHPTLIGASSVDDWQHWLKYNLTPSAGASRFLMGSFNISGMVGLLESMTMVQEIGAANIDAYVTSLMGYAMDRISELGVEMITPTTPGSYGPIVTFKVADSEEETVKLLEGLKARKIAVSKHWNAHDVAHLRVSLHCFNTQHEVDQLVDSLKELRS